MEKEGLGKCACRHATSEIFANYGMVKLRHADIRRALLERHGELGRLLNATEAAESGELMAIRTACDALPIFSPSDLTTFGLAAAAWYDDHVRGHRSN
jgi:c-di-GMP-related signal transduction protein